MKFRRHAVQPRRAGRALHDPRPAQARRRGRGLAADGFGVVRRRAVRQPAARCADAAGRRRRPHRTGAARAGLHGLVRAPRPDGVRLRMGLARRHLQRPHAARGLRRRRRGAAVGGRDRGDGDQARTTGASTWSRTCTCCAICGPRTTRRSKASSSSSPTSRWSRSRSRIHVRSGLPPTPNGCPAGQADSGGSEFALTRVGKIADGWMTHSVSPDGLPPVMGFHP